jgi:hypothetical protein
VIDARTLRGLGAPAVAAAAELEAKLATVVVGLDLGDGPTAAIIGGSLADQLVRWFRRFKVGSPAARVALEQAADWAGATIAIDAGPADHWISIGRPSGHGRDLYVGADGWRAHVSRRVEQPLGQPGLGAPAAAYLAMLELFKTVFADWVEVESCDEVHLSLFDWTCEGSDPGPPTDDVDLGSIVWVGSGAIAHGGYSAIHDLPGFRGQIDLVDPDSYGASTIRRYPRAAAAWEGRPKASTIGPWLAAMHPGLRVVGHQTDVNSWFESSLHECLVPLVVTTPDSADARRHAALKLPEVAINGYAERFDIGVGTYRLGEGPCLGCRYPMSQEAVTEVAVFHAEVGLEPRRIRELLDSAAPLTEQDLVAVQRHLWFDEASLAAMRDKPLRSVREHLCAVGRITAPQATAELDVPLGFVSALCGVAVVADLVRHAIGQTRDPGWKVDLRQPITSTLYWPQAPRPGCFICGDVDYVAVHQEKYATQLVTAGRSGTRSVTRRSRNKGHPRTGPRSSQVLCGREHGHS